LKIEDDGENNEEDVRSPSLSSTPSARFLSSVCLSVCP